MRCCSRDDRRRPRRRLGSHPCAYPCAGRDRAATCHRRRHPPAGPGCPQHAVRRHRGLVGAQQASADTAAQPPAGTGVGARRRDHLADGRARGFAGGPAGVPGAARETVRRDVAEVELGQCGCPSGRRRTPPRVAGGPGHPLGQSPHRAGPAGRHQRLGLLPLGSGLHRGAQPADATGGAGLRRAGTDSSPAGAGRHQPLRTARPGQRVRHDPTVPGRRPAPPYPLAVVATVRATQCQVDVCRPRQSGPRRRRRDERPRSQRRHRRPREHARRHGARCSRGRRALRAAGGPCRHARGGCREPIRVAAVDRSQPPAAHPDQAGGDPPGRQLRRAGSQRPVPDRPGHAGDHAEPVGVASNVAARADARPQGVHPDRDRHAAGRPRAPGRHSSHLAGLADRSPRALRRDRQCRVRRHTDRAVARSGSLDQVLRDIGRRAAAPRLARR